MSLGHGVSTVLDGLVMYLDAANPKSYPGSGTAWVDLSSNNNNGTLIAGVTYNAAGYMSFDGSTGYVSSNFIPDKNNGTITTFFNLNVLKNYNTIFDNNLSVDDWEMWVYNTGVLAFRTNANNSDIRFDISGIVANNWYNVALTWTNTESNIYINSALAGQDTSMGTRIQPAQLNIGGKNNTQLDGKLSNFCVYNRALSAAEIQQNFNALRGRYGI